MSGRQLPFENVMIDDSAPGIISAAELQRFVLRGVRLNTRPSRFEKLTRIANLFNHLKMLILQSSLMLKVGQILNDRMK